MAVNYGSKRIVVGAHYGTRDWLAQRVTAVLMALFTLIVLARPLAVAVLHNKAALALAWAI
jgi:succinate dehydrogenase / fumarate reductase membrane anchor subunit